MRLLTAITLRVTIPRLNPAPLRPVVLGVMLFVAATALPSYTAGENADEGWSQLLAHLASTDARAGVDYIFPYGPLFELVLSPYEPSRFWHKYALELIGKAAMTLLLVRFAQRMSPLAG